MSTRFRFSLAWLLSGLLATEAVYASSVLFPAPEGAPAISPKAREGCAVRTLPGGALLVETDGSRDWQGANLAFADGPRDFSGAGLLSVVVSNACDTPFRVHATLATGAWQGRRPSYFATLRPGETRDIPLRLWFAPWVLDAPLDLPGMKNAPKAAADSTFDLRACTAIEVHLGKAAGRPDGENFECGFVTVCDIPYPALVAAARDIAGEMYRRRFAPAQKAYEPHPRQGTAP